MKYKISKAGKKGKGVFATKDIKKGETVVVWHPKKTVSKEGMQKLSDYEQNHTTPTGDGKYFVMGEPERYINHSCNLNTYVKNKKDVALKNIKKEKKSLLIIL